MKYEKLILYITLSLFFFSAISFANPQKKFHKKKNKYKKGEILVKYKASSQANRGAYFKKRFNYSKIKTFRRSRIHHLKLPKNKSVPAAVEELLRDPNVEYAEPNYAYYATATPNDEHFSKLWGLDNLGQPIGSTSGTPDADIDAPEAWDITTDAENVIVAVVDSGVDYNHPDLADNIWVNTGEIPGNGVDDDDNGKIDDVRGWDFVDDDNDPMDLNGHGTHVAGTIGAVGDNGIGITGVAWNTQIMIVRGLNPRGWGWTSNLAEAIEYASENGADVINLSWGGGNESDTLKETIENSPALLVCAAGNDSEDTDIEPHYPSSYTYSNIISVAATDPDDNLASFSNYGNTSVDVAAPGVEIYSTISSRKTIFSDDFDDGSTSGWIKGGTNNDWGVTSTNHSIAPSSLADSPPGNYSNNTNSWIQTPPLDLSSEDRISFNFDFTGVVLSGDRFPCEVSTNGSDWVEIDGGSFNYDDWYDAGYDVTSYKRASTSFRFRLISDGSGTEDGVYVDDVEITAFDEYTYAYKSGTSMAAPHVAGIAAIIKALRPDFTAINVKGAIEDNVDVLPSLAGEVSTGGRVNLDNTAQDVDLKYFSLGEEFQINTYTSRDEELSDVAFVGNGYSMVAWQSQRTGYVDRIRTQIFDPSGNKFGAEFSIGPLSTNKENPKVASLSNNTFLVAYYINSKFVGQLLDHLGNEIGTPIDISPQTNRNLIGITGLKNGGFVATFEVIPNTYAQVFDNSGNPISNLITVRNSYNTFPDVSSLNDGGFVVVYDSYDGSEDGIYAQIYDRNGTLLIGDFLVNSTITGDQDRPKVAGLTNGGFAVIWIAEDISLEGVFSQIFNENGEKIGNEFQVNSYSSYTQMRNSISSIKNGCFLITWQNNGDIFAQLFSGNGDKISNDFQINSFNPGTTQQFSTAAGSTSGVFFVTWTSSNQDGYLDGIFGSRINIFDQDSDDIIDFIEETACSKIDDPDTDNDEIEDGVEDSNFNGIFDEGETSPCLTDSDGDNLGDGVEDANRNGIVDAGETDPSNSDTDGDGMPDGFEVAEGLDALVFDTFEDKDNDGYSNFREFLSGTSPDDNLSVPDLLADLDEDLDVDGQDLINMAQEMGRVDCEPATPCRFDFNGDRTVDYTDLKLFCEDFSR